MKNPSKFGVYQVDHFQSNPMDQKWADSAGLERSCLVGILPEACNLQTECSVSVLIKIVHCFVPDLVLNMEEFCKPQSHRVVKVAALTIFINFYNPSIFVSELTPKPLKTLQLPVRHCLYSSPIFPMFPKKWEVFKLRLTSTLHLYSNVGIRAAESLEREPGSLRGSMPMVFSNENLTIKRKDLTIKHWGLTITNGRWNTKTLGYMYIIYIYIFML